MPRPLAPWPSLDDNRSPQPHERAGPQTVRCPRGGISPCSWARGHGSPAGSLENDYHQRLLGSMLRRLQAQGISQEMVVEFLSLKFDGFELIIVHLQNAENGRRLVGCFCCVCVCEQQLVCLYVGMYKKIQLYVCIQVCVTMIMQTAYAFFDISGSIWLYLQDTCAFEMILGHRIEGFEVQDLHLNEFPFGQPRRPYVPAELIPEIFHGPNLLTSTNTSRPKAHV